MQAAILTSKPKSGTPSAECTVPVSLTFAYCSIVNSKSPLLVQRALLCIEVQMRSLTLAFLPTRSRR